MDLIKWSLIKEQQQLPFENKKATVGNREEMEQCCFLSKINNNITLEPSFFRVWFLLRDWELLYSIFSVCLQSIRIKVDPFIVNKFQFIARDLFPPHLLHISRKMLVEATLAFSWFVYAFETYLDIRQHRKLKEKKLPKELEGVVE